MSSPKVTLSQLIEKWKPLTNGSTKIMHDEMTSLFEEAVEAGIPGSEITKRKGEILRIWVALTWPEAQKQSEQVRPDGSVFKWTNRSWWQDRKDSALRIYAKVYKDHFESKPEPVKEKPAVKTEAELYKDIPTFTNVEDLLKWREKRLSNG